MVRLHFFVWDGVKHPVVMVSLGKGNALCY